MRTFLKRTNRGLVLSAIILAILVIFVSVDYAKFNSQKDIIKDTLKDYIEVTLESNVQHSDDAAQTNAINEIIPKYWSENEGSVSFATTRRTLHNNLESAIKDKDMVFGATDVDYSILTATVRKAGPGIARISLEYKAHITAPNNTYVYTPADIEPMYYYNDSGDIYVDGDEGYDDYEDEDDEQNKVSDVECSFSYTAEAVVEMVYENGTWKISNWDGYIYNSTYSPVADE